MMMVATRVMMVGLSSHIHNGGRDRQNGRVLVFNELGDPLADDIEEQDKPDDDEYLHIFPPLNSRKVPHAWSRPF